VHIVEKLNRLGRVERKLMTELGREPTVEEIAEVAGIEPQEVESIKPTCFSSEIGARALHIPLYWGSMISTAPNPSIGLWMKKISIVMSGSTWAWLRNASTLRPVSASIVSV
jgi:hypothetical protein